MTEETANKVANVVIVAAAAAAAYYVVSTVPLRRLPWRAALVALTGTLPAWFGREVQQAWSESGRGTV